MYGFWGSSHTEPQFRWPWMSRELSYQVRRGKVGMLGDFCSGALSPSMAKNRWYRPHLNHLDDIVFPQISQKNRNPPKVPLCPL